MVEPPRGMYPSRLDDKGRAKMPAAFQQFFAALREKKLFVTSLDRRIAQIYPMAVWRQNEKFFDSYRDDPRLARNVAFNAADLGAEAEMDAQGRILFSPELRRELGIENAPVRLFAYRGRIEVLSEKLYEDAQAGSVRDGARGCGKAGGGRAGLIRWRMHFSVMAAESTRVAGGAAGRNLPGRDRRAGRAHGADCGAAGTGVCDRQRSRRAIARDGAAEHPGVGGADPVSPGHVRRAAETVRSEGFGESGRPAGRSGSQPVSVDGARERFFVLVGWAAGYAHGPDPGHDGGRSGQSHTPRRHSPT